MNEFFQNIDEVPPTIERVLVVPKNPRYCRYWLNDSKDVHVKTREGLLRYLVSLCPTRARDLSMIIQDYYISFLLLVKTAELIPLKTIKDKENLEFSSEKRVQEKMKKFIQNSVDEIIEKNVHPSETGEYLVQHRLEILHHQQKELRLRTENLPKWGSR